MPGRALLLIGPHGTCFHAAPVVSTPSNWKVSLMLCGNRMCPPGRVSTYSDVQGPANQQTSFSGRDDECVAHKLPFSGHIIKKFRGPSILQLNIEGLTASKMNVLHHLAIQLEAFVILLQETHSISAEKLVLSFAAVLFTSLTLNALLTIWCSGQTALFLSLLAKTALAYLPTALSVPSRPPFSFQHAQYAQVFLLKPAPSCTLFAGLGSTNKSAIFFFSYLTLALSSSPCSLLHISFYLNLCQKLFSLFSSSIRLQWVPGHSFLPHDDAANELARRGALLVPSAMPCNLSSLISGIHSSLFSDWRHTVSSKFFDTQVPSISTKLTCASTTYSLCSLSPSLQRTHPKLISL